MSHNCGPLHEGTLQETDRLALAERLAGEWYDAVRKQDLRKMGSIAGMPFYDGDLVPRVFTSHKAVRAHYGAPRSKEAKSDNETSMLAFRSNSSREWKREGVLSGNEPVFSHIRVQEDDIVVFIRLVVERFRDASIPDLLKGFGVVVLVRMGSEGPKIHGYWMP